ncbi:MED14-domain-containing protein [Dothidotthia symphoricarpi CBS 119687]|uniref:Mediator of RNA polymerase II transcription subunit 14 n=1 Tax=Dothidotthia symphoricarpi CBS 119687 TaxID=1392245 RepID=A0A6A6ADU5_9PLEO|nr:MED14-domain-containing protein [Dothidotthia symphoricarpi CBS 119687]KAF2129950.1 MED14-domain-containing protein [Dothidotthia symphoricarpi CBS 119687]
MNQSAPAVPPASRDGESKKRNHDGRMDSNTNGAVMAVSAPSGPAHDHFLDLPPEIAHVPVDLYHPLSTLLMRISQECYNDLSEVLQKMADMPLAQQLNGALTNGMGQQNVEANRHKKLLLMRFAQENRAKFIKLLVLTEWGKKSAVDVAKLIDVFAWAVEQTTHMNNVDAQMEEIKKLSNHARQNNPDIRTALEILSTGKASWMPTLDYIQPEPISSEKALKLLRYMNTSLSIRMNVHETLPRHLRNWRIESGRVTFVIENEMEFDIVSFVEDASDQWFFIDLRLLFSPAPSITVGSRFFYHLKLEADTRLREHGLSGLFDYLHNFILTHKISVLRSQTMGLLRSGWAGSLKVEPVHRQLVVQYWVDRPGKKNWIEIGVSSNRPKNGKVSWRGPPIPSLTARWFRQGKEVHNADLKLDWRDLSIERILKRVIALHVGDGLRSIREHLNSKMTIQACLSDTEPADCMLKTTLGTDTNSTTLSIEPVTGSYILRPATALSARAEYALNQGREPAQIGKILTQMLAQTLRDLVQRYAQQLGWQLVTRQSLHADAVKAAVKLDVLQYALYWPQGWSQSWALAVVIDSSGESWWITKLSSSGTSIEYAEQIKLNRPDGSSLPINRSTLASLERVAVQLLSFRVTARQLEKEGKSFSLQEFGPDTQRIVRNWTLYLETSDLLTTKPGQDPWLESNIAVTCEGLKSEGRSVWHIAAGRMVKAVAADMQKLMATAQQSNFSFSEDGTFKILLSTPFGTDILGELRARLRDVNRLRSFAATLQRREMKLGSSSLQKVQFQYGILPHVAAVNFASDKEIRIEMSEKNPAHRVHNLLTELINERSPSLPDMYFGDSNGLDRFCTTLLLTRSLLSVLRHLETQTPGNARNPAVHTHSLFKYRLTYENPLCTFDIRLQPKHDKVYWFIEDTIKRAPDLRPSPERAHNHRRLDTLQASLKKLFTTKGNRWFGTRNGIIADLDAVPDALRKLHTVVLSCSMEGGYKAPPPLEAPAPVHAPANPPPQALAQQIASMNQSQNHIQLQQRLQQHQHQQQQQQQQQQQGRPHSMQVHARQLSQQGIRIQQQQQQQHQNARTSQLQRRQSTNRGMPLNKQDVIEID